MGSKSSCVHFSLVSLLNNVRLQWTKLKQLIYQVAASEPVKNSWFDFEEMSFTVFWDMRTPVVSLTIQFIGSRTFQAMTFFSWEECYLESSQHCFGEAELLIAVTLSRPVRDCNRDRMLLFSLVCCYFHVVGFVCCTVQFFYPINIARCRIYIFPRIMICPDYA